MRPIVRDTFREWSVPKEGRIRCMYLDLRGYVTTAIGLLIDDTSTLTPPARAFALPWRTQGGALATASEVRAEWIATAVLSCESTDGSVRRTGKPRKGDGKRCAWTGTSKVCLAHRGWLAAWQVTRLRLDDEAVDEITDRTRDAMWATLVRRFPALDAAPADAQRAALSFAWAMGPEFPEHGPKGWPKLSRALRESDWATAAKECRMMTEDDPRTPESEANPGVVSRNAANHAHFLAAARVVAEKLDPDRFWAGVPAPAPQPAPVVDLAGAARATLGARRQMLSDALRRDDDEPPPDAA